MRDMPVCGDLWRHRCTQRIVRVIQVWTAPNGCDRGHYAEVCEGGVRGIDQRELVVFTEFYSPAVTAGVRVVRHGSR